MSDDIDCTNQGRLIDSMERHGSALEARVVELEAELEKKTRIIDYDTKAILEVVASNDALKLENTALVEAARDLATNVKRGTPIDITAVENQIALANAVQALLPEPPTED